MFRTGAQMALLVALAGLLLMAESLWWPVNAVEEAFADHLTWGDRLMMSQARARGWAASAKTPPVALVAIDEETLQEHPWPWRPIDYSLFLIAVRNHKPEVVAIEEVLNWDHVSLPPSERQKVPQYENMLRGSLLRTPKVLLGEKLGWPEDPDVVPPVEDAPLLHNVKGRLSEVPEWTALEQRPKEEFRLSATLGFINLPSGLPSTTRVPLVLRYQGQVVPSLVLQAVLLWHKVALDEVEVVLGSQISVGNLKIPIDDHGQMRLNFAAAPLRFGYDELLLADEQVTAKQKPVVPVERLAGGIALLGRTDPPSRTFPLAAGGHASRAEILATAIATIQSGAYLSRASRWVDFALIALAVLLSFRLPQWRKRSVALLAGVLFLLYLAAAFLALHFASLALPFTLPAGLLLFMALYRAATPNSVWRLRRPVIL